MWMAFCGCALLCPESGVRRGDTVGRWHYSLSFFDDEEEEEEEGGGEGVGLII